MLNCFWRNLTRRSENDNTPQPLDQWINSPFMGQKAGNCNSFTSYHYLSNVFPMHCGLRAIPLCAQQWAQLKSLSNLKSLKWIDLPIPKIWILKIWPWKSKVKAMGEVKVSSHNLGPTSYRLTSFWFHVNPPSSSYDRAFLKFDLQNSRSKS